MIIIFFLTPLYSKENTTDHSQNVVSGLYSIQFKIDRFFTLSSFEGSLISFTKHISENKSVRLGVSAYGETYDTDDNSWANADYIEHTDNCKTTHNLTIVTNILFYPNSKNTIKFYYGLGPLFQYSRNKDNKYIDLYDDAISDDELISHYAAKDTEQLFGFGMNFTWGAEWFPYKHISLLAEYGADFIYSISNRETRLENFYDSHDHKLSEKKLPKYSFYPSNVKFGISIYLNK